MFNRLRNFFNPPVPTYPGVPATYQPRHGYNVTPLKGEMLLSMARYWATGHYSPSDPLWHSIDRNYDPKDAQGFSPKIAQYVNAYEPMIEDMRTPEWQALVRLRAVQPGV
jgi:hypothetical protein